MWKEIQASMNIRRSDSFGCQLMYLVISKLNLKELVLYMQDASPGLQKYAAVIAETQIAKDKQYKAAIEAQKTSQDSATLVLTSTKSQALDVIEKPLPANKVAPYDPDVFGLEVAARDCRFEMIKIVREVLESPLHLLMAMLTQYIRLTQPQRIPKLLVIRIVVHSI
jgi:hypothetical protein